jgi:hypothetical protein
MGCQERGERKRVEQFVTSCRGHYDSAVSRYQLVLFLKRCRKLLLQDSATANEMLSVNGNAGHPEKD